MSLLGELMIRLQKIRVGHYLCLTHSHWPHPIIRAGTLHGQLGYTWPLFIPPLLGYIAGRLPYVYTYVIYTYCLIRGIRHIWYMKEERRERAYIWEAWSSKENGSRQHMVSTFRVHIHIYSHQSNFERQVLTGKRRWWCLTLLVESAILMISSEDSN